MRRIGIMLCVAAVSVMAIGYAQNDIGLTVDTLGVGDEDVDKVGSAFLEELELKPSGVSFTGADLIRTAEVSFSADAAGVYTIDVTITKTDASTVSRSATACYASPSDGCFESLGDLKGPIVIGSASNFDVRYDEVDFTTVTFSGPT